MKVKKFPCETGELCKFVASLGKEWDPKTWNRKIYLRPDETKSFIEPEKPKVNYALLLIYCISAQSRSSLPALQK